MFLCPAIFISKPTVIYPTSITLAGDGASYTTGDTVLFSWTVDGGSTDCTVYLNGSSYTSGSSPQYVTFSTAGSNAIYVVSNVSGATSNTDIEFVSDPSGNAATWLGYDSSTQGNWVGVYGTDGYVIPDPTYGPYPEYGSTFLIAPPSYATFGASSGVNAYTWNNNDAVSNSDPRATQYPSNGGPRIASTWYTGVDGYYVLDLTITGGTAKTVRLYMLDWDNIGRTGYITIQDGDTLTTLDTQYVDTTTPYTNAYANGTWFSWAIKGHVKIIITNTSASNATNSGIYFDP